MVAKFMETQENVKGPLLFWQSSASRLIYLTVSQSRCCRLFQRSQHFACCRTWHLQSRMYTSTSSIIININGRDVQRNNVVNNVDKSSLWAPLQNSPYKNTQNHKTRSIQRRNIPKEITIFCVFRIFWFYFQLSIT